MEDLEFFSNMEEDATSATPTCNNVYTPLCSLMTGFSSEQKRFLAILIGSFSLLVAVNMYYHVNTTACCHKGKCRSVYSTAGTLQSVSYAATLQTLSLEK